MKNSADQGGCYPQRPKAEVDNTLQDLQNSSYPMKAEFNNYCFIIYSKYLLVLKGVLPFRSLFFRSPNIIWCPLSDRRSRFFPLVHVLSVLRDSLLAECLSGL